MAPPDKLSVIVFSGAYERVHYALVLASAAAAMGRAVTLFFTMEGTRALVREGAAAAPDWTAPEADRAARGVATLAEMMRACVDLGVTFMVCEMGLRVMGIDRAALRADLPLAEGGAVTFLNDASRHGAMLFV